MNLIDVNCKEILVKIQCFRIFSLLCMNHRSNKHSINTNETMKEDRSDSNLLSNSFLLPSHYQATIRRLLQFAATMFIVALLIGVVSRETSRIVNQSKVPPGQHRINFQTIFLNVFILKKISFCYYINKNVLGVNLQATIVLDVIHGHTFMMGSIIPLCMCTMLIFGQIVGGAEINPRSLKVSNTTLV